MCKFFKLQSNFLPKTKWRLFQVQGSTECWPKILLTKDDNSTEQDLERIEEESEQKAREPLYIKSFSYSVFTTKRQKTMTDPKFKKIHY